MISVLSDVKKTLRYLKRNGVVPAYYAAKERLEMRRNDNYCYTPPDDATLAKQRTETAGFAGKPLITMVIPAYNTPERYLAEAIESVIDQSYTGWILYVGDASDPGNDAVSRVVNSYSDDERIRYIRLKENTGISGNTNAVLDHVIADPDWARTDYIGLLDHDDRLTPDALYHMAVSINAHMHSEPSDRPAVLYSDEDKIEVDYDDGVIRCLDCHTKYKFNLDLLFSNNYICHLMLIRADIVDKLRLRSAFDGAQDYDLVLRVVSYLTARAGVRSVDLDKHIIHIPHVLYHWRSHPGSTAANTNSKTYAYEAGLEALTEAVNAFCGPEKSKNDCDEAQNAENDNNGGYPKTSHSKHLGFYDTDWGTDETIFDLRQDIGAVIGRVYDRRGRMTSILWNEDGEALYFGLNKHYAGAFNRFDCGQDVFAADIRYVGIRPGLEHLADEAAAGAGFSDLTSLLSSADPERIKQAGMIFGRLMREQGYLILYIPGRTS